MSNFSQISWTYRLSQSGFIPAFYGVTDFFQIIRSRTSPQSKKGSVVSMISEWLFLLVRFTQGKDGLLGVAGTIINNYGLGVCEQWC